MCGPNFVGPTFLAQHFNNDLNVDDFCLEVIHEDKLMSRRKMEVNLKGLQR